MNPFSRQDHYRDHLRTFHLEDIFRRGNRGDEEWWNTRSKRALHMGWWRCSRCLVRVSQAEHGWHCPGCRNMCEKERKEYRTIHQGEGQDYLRARRDMDRRNRQSYGHVSRP